MTGPSDTLEPFRTAHARELAGWAATAAEARRWGGQDVVWPVAASVVSAWHADPGVRPFVLVRSGMLLGYGEVWIDEEEREVELARIIVRPERRGRGLGRLLVRLLLEQAAQTGHQTAFVRVAPGNAAALACYRNAGLAPVSEEERQAFNEGQPLEYVWLRRELR
ncbi:MAG TPA: GNAT family N-acetyltransferase [Thermoleophilia bacterium]|nr:GNAT family N-acetyltransferase [Thermoleophilia bacterium]